MMKAIIDIGSNSVRLCIFADGKILLREKITCQLGEGLYPDMLLTAPSISRSVQAVKTFFDVAVERGVLKEDILPFATAAVRKAKNGDEFCRRVFEETGLEVDVLSGEKEADIGLIGALFDKDGAVLDIGGASTELAVRKGGKTVFAKSLDIGAVRLTDEFSDDREKLNAYVGERVKEYGEIEIDNLVAIGGTATTLGFVNLGDSSYDMNRVNGCEISLKELEGISDRLFACHLDERAERFNLESRRARVVCAGSVILLTVLKYLNLPSLTVSEMDNLDGYYYVKTGKVKYDG